ncbi:MAG: hypothetical protein WC530_11060 [Candidatus Omnitrophota bacterium]
MISIFCNRVEFYSQNDEASFFDFVGRIDAVDSIAGMGDTIHLHVVDQPSEESLRDLLALFHRYRLPKMTQLSQFKNRKNQKWFTDTDAYWHKKVFPVKSKNA